MKTYKDKIKAITPRSGYTKDLYKDSAIAINRVDYELYNNNLSNYKFNKSFLMSDWARIVVAFDELPHIKNINDLDEVLEIISDRDKFHDIMIAVYEEAFERLGM